MYYSNTIGGKLDLLKNNREEAIEFFYSKLSKDPSDSIAQYHYHDMIWTTMMISSSLEEFISNCIIKYAYAKKLFNFAEEFDYISHCVKTGWIYAGKKNMILKQYSYLAAQENLVNYYKIKCWKFFGKY